MNKPYMEANLVHIPVLRQSVKKFLDLKPGEIAVDGTLGLGGHALEMAEMVGKSGHVYGFDQDASHLSFAAKRLDAFKDRVTLFHSNFSQLSNCLHEAKIEQVDALLFDLGLASPHVDRPERGFSFLSEGPLDMRFDPSTGETAADILNLYPESELVRFFQNYGEERHARHIARAIVQDRKLQPFTSTTQLASLIIRLYPPRERRGKIHPATKIFQALRIAVNHELDVLENVLPQAVSLLRSGGRLVIISYHSLEDRIVKHFLKSQAASCICLPEVLRCECRGKPILSILTKKPVTPSEEEIIENPRSRSAKLRAAVKL